MEVYGNLRQRVEIDPIDVIEELVEQEIGRRNWVFEKDGKYYRGYETSAGSHSIECEEPICKKLYDYIIALEYIQEYLKKGK